MMQQRMGFSAGKVLASLLALGCALAVVPATAAEVVLGDFQRDGLNGWTAKSFKGETRYSLVQDPGEGMVVRAEADGAASGMFRELPVDLQQTPCLTWSWRVERGYQGLDETTKQGDDYPARLYVVFSGGLFFWKTRALNYVWSGSQPAGHHWPNAFTGNAVMVAVESGPQHHGEWLTETRNVLQDYRQLIGGEATRADAVAIMSDGDNSGGHAVAYYGGIRFDDSCLK